MLILAFSMELSTLSPVMVQIRWPSEIVSPASQLSPVTLPEASAVTTLEALRLMDV